ncbi:hypothetical protein SELSPUOL_02151 [Selenomonas sputigena ATCC 35185]|uniref:Uncharacterized protein n=1 Tax=Selenomonas sputigena (strain ATCC 35185 / DSM 20758 / CCUG 44933 / VPI D19B-28) TaxID=546271 RepID=C9LXE4_SELS3|nr:hypothetical protein SELSPUOL_02151 [Selenomonas sputigena ATCC 35185]
MTILQTAPHFFLFLHGIISPQKTTRTNIHFVNKRAPLSTKVTQSVCTLRV